MRGLRFLAFVLFFAGAASALVMWLWNYVLAAAVEGVRPISFWQALGLLLLARILFGGFRMGYPPAYRKHNPKYGHLKDKWMDMSPEERARFKEAWRKRCESKQ